MRRLRTIGRLAVAADLDFEYLERGAEAGFEQNVQELAALRLEVVNQQARSCATTRQASKPPELIGQLSPVDRRQRCHHVGDAQA